MIFFSEVQNVGDHTISLVSLLKSERWWKGSKDLNVNLIVHVSSTQSRPTSKCTQLFSHNITAVFKASQQFLWHQILTALTGL